MWQEAEVGRMEMVFLRKSQECSRWDDRWNRLACAMMGMCGNPIRTQIRRLRGKQESTWLRGRRANTGLGWWHWKRFHSDCVPTLMLPGTIMGSPTIRVSRSRIFRKHHRLGKQAGISAPTFAKASHLFMYETPQENKTRPQTFPERNGELRERVPGHTV